MSITIVTDGKWTCSDGSSWNISMDHCYIYGALLFWFEATYLAKSSTRQSKTGKHPFSCLPWAVHPPEKQKSKTIIKIIGTWHILHICHSWRELLTLKRWYWSTATSALLKSEILPTNWRKEKRWNFCIQVLKLLHWPLEKSCRYCWILNVNVHLDSDNYYTGYYVFPITSELSFMHLKTHNLEQVYAKSICLVLMQRVIW